MPEGWSYLGARIEAPWAFATCADWSHLAVIGSSRLFLKRDTREQAKAPGSYPTEYVAYSDICSESVLKAPNGLLGPAAKVFELKSREPATLS